MIRVKVDLVPFGVEDQSKQIGELVLANIANLGLGRCVYAAVYEEGDGTIHHKKVEHSRQDGAWELIRIILSAEEAEDPTENIFMRLKEKLG